MADVTLKYKGATIGELSESGSKTLETAGKYCEADILLEYIKPSSPTYPFFKSYERIVVKDNALESGSIQNFRDRYMPGLPDSQDGYPNILVIIENTMLDTSDNFIGLAAIQFSSPWGGANSLGRYFARRANIQVNTAYDFHIGQGSVIHKFTFDRDRS